MADNEIRLNVSAVESEPLNVCVEQVPMNPVNVDNTYKGIDYNLLKNKPSIDGVPLEGDKTTAEVIGFDKEYVDEAILATNAKIDEVSSREGYSKKEIDDKLIVIEADIDAQADAIQKTRSDFMESDSELQQQINAHAEELTTQKNDIDELGDQVAEIESKIPEGTSDTNPLINKQQLLDEEMDIRSDFNESVSELQTQITAQASAIANKVDVTGDTMTGALNLPELNVATPEGTLNLSITAGVATIATNNGLDIVSQTKFDTAPTTDDSTTWEDALDISLVRKAQVATAIAEAGGGGSVPDNVYTKTNLLGGKEIEIVPEPVEGGIDENTVACWHFDEKNTDEVNGLALENIGIYGNNPYDTSRMKFGTACIYDFSSSTLKTNDISSLNLTDTDWTLDLWFYQTNYQSSGSGKYGLQTSSKNVLGFKIYRYEIRLEGNMWGNAAGTSVATSTLNTWTHATLQHSHLNKKGFLFINGQKVYEGAVTDVTGQTFNALYLGHATGPSLLIDEMRISNVLRWEEDFEVPTKAYEVPKPTGNMVVNFVGESLQKGADYVIESYNDGTNWYRVYKSGWIEQGGYVTGAETYTLLKPMMDTNYIVLVTERDTTAPTQTEGSPRAGAISTTQIYINGGKGSSGTINYYVCGQGA